MQLLDSDQAIVGVASRDQVDAMRDFTERHDLQDVANIADVDGEVWRRFGVTYQPTWGYVDGDTGEVTVRFGALGVNGVLAAFEADGL